VWPAAVHAIVVDSPASRLAAGVAILVFVLRLFGLRSPAGAQWPPDSAVEFANTAMLVPELVDSWPLVAERKRPAAAAVSATLAWPLPELVDAGAPVAEREWYFGVVVNWNSRTLVLEFAGLELTAVVEQEWLLAAF